MRDPQGTQLYYSTDGKNFQQLTEYQQEVLGLILSEAHGALSVRAERKGSVRSRNQLLVVKSLLELLFPEETL